MITLTTEQAQQIEEALEDLTYEDHDGTIRSGKREDVDVTDTAGKALATIRAARAQEQAEQEPVEREHITDGSLCWCNPELNYKDPETGAEVWVHKEPQ